MKQPLLHTLSFIILFIVCSPSAGHAQNFTWKKGANVPGMPGSAVTPGVASSTNDPGARFHAVSWTDASGMFWLFGGTGFDNVGSPGLLNDLWKYNPISNEWTWVKGDTIVNQVGVYSTLGNYAAANKPGARQNAHTFTGLSGNLFLFGGYGYDGSGSFGELNDMWEYDISLNQWRWLKGATTCFQTATYGTQGTPAMANTPGARYSGTAWRDGVGDFWIFGGIGYNGSANSYLNDLWKYTIATNQWTWVKGSNLLNQTGIYGTQGTASTANAPGARASAAAVTDAAGNLWLIGGNGFAASGPANLMSDMWKYHIATSEWTWVQGYNNAGTQQGTYGTQNTYANSNLPGARYDAITWLDGTGDLWYFGGYGFATGGTPDNLNDLWRFNTNSNQWKWVKGGSTISQPGIYNVMGIGSPLNVPGSRGGGVSWKDNSNNLYLFGGSGFDAISNVGKLNDLWKFSNCIGPTVSVSASSASICEGYSTTLTASGANTYTWTGAQNTPTLSVSPAGATTFSVYGTDAYDCKDTATFLVNVWQLPTISAVTNSAVICPFQFTSLTASGAVTYTWSNSQQGANISVGPLASTAYTVMGTDINGCVNSTAITQSVSACLSLPLYADNAGAVSIFPNPSKGAFSIHTSTIEHTTLLLINNMGQIVFAKEIVGSENQVDTGLPAGVYFYQLKNSVQQVTQGKLVIE